MSVLSPSTLHPALADSGSHVSGDVVQILGRALDTQDRQTSNVANARELLQTLMTDDKAALSKIMASQNETLHGHNVKAQELAANASNVRRSLTALEAAFDVSNPQAVKTLAKFLDRSAGRHSASQEVHRASSTTRLLQSILLSYAQLERTEDAVWAGKGADTSVLNALGTQDLQGADSQEPLVLIAIKNRCKLIRSMLTEQLGNAWIGAISVTGDDKSLRVQLKEPVQIPAPKVARLTKSSAMDTVSPVKQSYSLSDIYHAVAAVDTLPSLLRDLQARILHTIIHPIIDTRQWVAVQSEDLSLRLARTDEQPALEVVGAVRAALSFIHSSVYPPTTGASLQLRDQFLDAIQADASQRILDQLILPAMPCSLDDVPRWLQLVRHAAEWEATLVSSEKPAAILQTFKSRQAGERWLHLRREHDLQQARRIVYRDWSAWASRKISQPEVDSQLPSTATDLTIEDDVAWGFNDSSQPSIKGAEVTMASEGGDNLDGWGFDETAPVPAPLPVLQQPKPTREAKRLGRKVNARAVAQPNPPPVEDVRMTPSPSPPPAPVKVPSETSQATGPLLDNSQQVSVVCDAVLEVVANTLLDLQKVDALAAETSFAAVGRGLLDQLTQTLDIIRASAPIAHTAHLRAQPTAALQLRNDFQYLASRITDCQPTVSWASRLDMVARFNAASQGVLLTCIRNQQAVLAELLEPRHHLVDTGRDQVYVPAERAIADATSHIQSLAVQVECVIDRADYHFIIGKLVEFVCTQIIDDILSLEDITEVESGRLSGLIAYIQQSERLFERDGSQVFTIATHVPHWLKLCYTNELLQGNLADISHLLGNGSLVDFSSEELSKLVRALFADSPMRSALLEKLDGVET